MDAGAAGVVTIGDDECALTLPEIAVTPSSRLGDAISTLGNGAAADADCGDSAGTGLWIAGGRGRLTSIKWKSTGSSRGWPLPERRASSWSNMACIVGILSLSRRAATDTADAAHPVSVRLVMILKARQTLRAAE